MSKFGTKKKGKHWAERAREVTICRDQDKHFNVTIEGGADNAQFLYLGDLRQERVHYKGSGKLHLDDLILEVNGKRVSGLIRKDVISLIKRSADPLRLRVCKPGNSLTRDLAHYLSKRFQKGSIDHELQQTIRDNLYTRTIPCTTRPPRPGEKSGVDYTFLSVDEFLVMERSNNLLESGLYGGNYYGTPKPPSDPDSPQIERKGEVEERFGGRNRSPGASHAGQSETHRAAPDLPPLGPLPSNWEVAYTEDNEKYFINHTTQTTHWLDPRIAALQQDGRLRLSSDEDVPYGWERAYDPKFGTYYIDHINRRTSYDKPRPRPERPAPPPPSANQAAADAKRREAEAAMRWPQAYDEENEIITPPPRTKRNSDRDNRDTWDDGRGGTSRVRNRFVTPEREREQEQLRNQMGSEDNGQLGYGDEEGLEAQLKGEVVHVALKKSPQGFGFTIVGGDSPGELLQIKSVVKNGVAAKSGKITIGDVLVRVNGICVLTYTHHEVVMLFQGVQPGADLTLELRRGYTLPADPDNPDAPMTPIRLKPVPPPYPRDRRQEQHNSSSIPNNVEPLSPLPPPVVATAEDGRKVELIQAGITKGQYGFGFTIAETAQGQKIKQIMDQERCRHLKERDLLIQINGQNVRNYSHGDVVSVLKQCVKGSKVAFVVERPIEGKKESNKARQLHQIPNNQVPVQTVFSEDVFDDEPQSPDRWDGRRDGLVPVVKEVVLRRQAQGFGFRLVGGREEGTQVYIGTIVPGGAADQSGQLDVGDEIVSVNGRSCDMASHKEVVGILGEAGKVGQVTLRIRRRVRKSASGEDGDDRESSLSDANGPREVILERRPDGGFGFVLQSSVNETGCTICRIIPESPAEFCKKLHVGDYLLAVNGKDVTKLHHTDVVGIIKRSGLRVTLHVDQADELSIHETEQRTGHEADEQFPPPPPPEQLEPPPDHDRYHTVQYDQRRGRHGIEEEPPPMDESDTRRPVRRDARGRYDPRNDRDQDRARYEQDRARNEPESPGRRRPDYHHHRDSPPWQQQGYDWGRRSPPQYNGERSRGHEDRGARGSRRQEMQSSQSPDPREFDRGWKKDRRERRDPPRYHQGNQRERFHDHEGLNNRADGYHGHTGHPDSASPEHSYNLDQHAMPTDPEVDMHFGDGHYNGDTIDVTLKRDQQQGFGFSIRGGREYQNTPLFILRIAEEGVAYKDGRLRVGDEILEINGESTADMRHTEAISLIKRGGDVVRLTVLRPPPEPDRHMADGAIPGGGAPRRGGDRRDVSPPHHHPSINQAVDTYFDQYMDSVKHRQGDAGYQKQSYKYARGVGYNA